MASSWLSFFIYLVAALIAPQVIEAATTMAMLTPTTVVPAVFIFGDSTFDVGTNDYLAESEARADNRFNGIDFYESKPTGRFSNGFNAADLIVRLMGYRRSPPSFLSLIHDNKPYFKRNLLRGVNFASGGSGILNETGQQFKRVISMTEQMEQFSTVHGNISQVMGAATAALLSKSIFMISVGSNDIVEHVVSEFLGSNKTHSGIDFMNDLINTYESHLKGLIELGAKKFGIISVPPIGCCPLPRLFNKTGGCIDELNIYAQIFYTRVEDLLQKLSLEHKGMKYSLGNVYEMTMDIIDNPLVFGFKEIVTACCGNGTFNAHAACTPSGKLCVNRKEYLFWDRFHPTEAACQLAALTLYGGSPKFVTPINFSQLIEI